MKLVLIGLGVLICVILAPIAIGVLAMMMVVAAPLWCIGYIAEKLGVDL